MPHIRAIKRRNHRRWGTSGIESRQPGIAPIIATVIERHLRRYKLVAHATKIVVNLNLEAMGRRYPLLAPRLLVQLIDRRKFAARIRDLLFLHRGHTQAHGTHKHRFARHGEKLAPHAQQQHVDARLLVPNACLNRQRCGHGVAARQVRDRAQRPRHHSLILAPRC